MTMNLSDTQLIQRFIESADQTAFEQLVERHVNLAYSAARSCLGRDDLARDACQLTFVELSRKASHLSDPARLGCWIYSTARNISRKIQRTEIRRQQREQRYMDQINTQAVPEPDWSHLVPEIHAALEHLKAADREAIILRYFQGRSLNEIGEILGVSADAVRMRVKRALEHLNAGLAKKGITSSSAALAAALPSHASLVAPKGLAASISATALVGTGAAVSSATLTGVVLAIMKAKTLIITAIAASVVIGGSIYLATLPDEDRIPSGSTTQSNDSRPNLIAQHINASSSDQGMGASGRPMPSDNEIPVRTAMDPPTGINPEQLEKAEQLFAMMEVARPLIESNPDLGQGDRIIKDSEALARKLELRLNMGEEQATTFNDILAAHANENAHRMEEAMQEANRKLSEFLKIDREIAVPLLALDMMKGEGQTLTPEQEAYYQTYSEQYGTGFDQGPDASDTYFERWYDNADVLAALEAQLDPAQQAELRAYVEEQKLREQEQRIYHRTNQLANELGLNEADRQALYDYLNEYPDATLEDIAEELTPELRDLLLKKSTQNPQ